MLLEIMVLNHECGSTTETLISSQNWSMGNENRLKFKYRCSTKDKEKTPKTNKHVE